MGTIPGKVGMKIRIKEVAICGDSMSSSGANRFKLNGGGLAFSWYAGQNNPGGTYQLAPTPSSGASRGFSYKTVNHLAQAGASLTITWDYHNDWDGLYCDATSKDGVKYKDSNSTVRAWVAYHYE